MIWGILTNTIAYVKKQKKKKIYYSLCQTYSPTVVYKWKVDLQKVDQRARGKWLIHDTATV